MIIFYDLIGENMKCEHMSVSRADTYNTCNYKYKLRYELAVIPEQKFYFVFGKIYHKIVEEYIKLKGEKDIYQITKMVLDGELKIDGDNVAPRLLPDQKNRLGQHIENFLKFNDKIGCIGECEVPFSIDLDPPHGKNWVGFIDRLIIKNDMYFIIDYKTSKKNRWRKNSITIRKDPQIIGYCYIIHKLYNAKPENIRALLFYSEDGDAIDSRTFTKEELEEVPKKLLDIYNNILIQDKDAVVGNVGEHCFNCDYSQICPFYNMKKTGF